jgi:hypothetical protein
VQNKQCLEKKKKQKIRDRDDEHLTKEKTLDNNDE